MQRGISLVNSAALVTTSRLNDFSEFLYPCMRMSLCACMRLSMCLHVHRGTCPQDFFGNTSLRLQSEVKLILASHPSFITCNSTYIMCASMCLSLCVRVCMYLIIMCSAGPEVAVLDRYGPEADPVYWRRGRGGGGCRTSGSV